jgi:hypothetical protein
MRPLLVAFGWAALASASPADDGATVTPVDPLRVADDDFARHRDPAEWRGLQVSQVEFRAERGRWRLFRIASGRAGPLWFVPHDNENAGFEAGLVAVRRYGGTMVTVDAALGGADGTRTNRAVDYGRPIDPNRNFDTGLPGYAARVLEHRAAGMPIIALHTNGKGFDTSESRCNRSDPPGSGVISIRYCDDVLRPSPSQAKAWPWDDDDTVAFATFLAAGKPEDAFCGNEMVAADFNVVFERVAASDGSLSNYAVLHGLHYLNFETLERGLEPVALAQARDRLVHAIDKAVPMCAPNVRAGQ